ncbi:MAG: hypothetical protein ChlgKO_15000 [Chlamydiales bacterium]
MKVRILKENVINQIAAGEVIENPASVVKELLENAIDAGAKKIQVDIRGGGFQLIRISDDGEGMDGDDALLCFERHGTSKIRTAEDLHALHSMGFRGEALASVCSISKIRLVTSMGTQATEVLATAGKILRKQTAARARGTTFEIRSLFFNTPARKRFQKSSTSSQTEITKVMTKMALSHPGIHLTLTAGEKPIFEVREGSLKERVEALLGKEFLNGAREMKEENFSGYVGSPLDARSNRSGQYLFINHRLVQCLPVSFAVEEGYGTRLSTRRYPTFVLFLEIPPDEIDVNVHPQKREVRLQNEEKVRAFVQQKVSALFAPSKSYVQPVAKPVDIPLVLPTKLQEDTPQTFFTEPELIAVGLFGKFYFAEKEEQLYLFDLAAASEQLFLTEENRNVTVPMLFPLHLDFAPHEAKKIREHLTEMEEFGISIRSFGENSFIVDALSPHIPETRVREFIEEWLGERGEVRKVFAKAASQKKKFSRYEAHELAEKILRICPDRPVYKPIREEDLERFITNQKVSASAT